MNRLLISMFAVAAVVLTGCGGDTSARPKVKQIVVTSTTATTVRPSTTTTSTTSTTVVPTVVPTTATTTRPVTTTRPPTTVPAPTTVEPAPTTVPPPPSTAAAPAPQKFTGNVLVVGDSMVLEAATDIQQASTDSVQIAVLGRAGSTPCDAPSQIGDTTNYDLVVFAYSGNDSLMSPCMEPSQDADLYGTYMDGYRMLESKVGAKKMRVVSAPVWPAWNGYDRSLEARRAASDWSASAEHRHVDAAMFLGGNEHFMEGQRQGIDPPGGNQVVRLRAADELHLCGAAGYSPFSGKPCPTSTAGTARYTQGILAVFDT